jgi:hypothetical protein
MKRLRLIKPWRLRAVRQRLQNDVRSSGEGQARVITGRGPSSQLEYINISSNCFNNSRICFNRDGRSDDRKIAPVSDAIFVLGNNRNVQWSQLPS